MRGAAEGKKLERGAIRGMISSLLAAFFGQWRESETQDSFGPNYSSVVSRVLRCFSVATI